MHTLSNLLVDQVLTTTTTRDGDSVHEISTALLVTRSGDSLGSNLLLALVLALLERLARASLASLVSTLGASLVGSVGGFALVAGAVHTHADVLLNTLCLGSGAEGQVRRLNLKTVFLEKSLGAFGGGHVGRRSGGVLRRAVWLVGTGSSRAEDIYN